MIFVLFYVWLISLSIMFSRFMHVVACVRIVFLFRAEWYSIVWICHILFIHSHIYEHLGCALSLIIHVVPFKLCLPTPLPQNAPACNTSRRSWSKRKELESLYSAVETLHTAIGKQLTPHLTVHFIYLTKNSLSTVLQWPLNKRLAPVPFHMVPLSSILWEVSWLLMLWVQLLTRFFIHNFQRSDW